MMVGIAEISAGLGSLKAAKDILQAMASIQTTADLNVVKIELQGYILDAQQALFAAQEAQAADVRRIAELEQQIAQLKSWAAEKDRYQLVNVFRGTVAYMPKPGMENGEPAHWLCTNCFDQGRKSFLVYKGQDQTKSGGNGAESTFGCNSCKASIKVSFRTKPEYAAQSEG